MSEVGGSDARMSRAILSVAVYEPPPGREQDSLETMGLLLEVLSAAGFSRDFLYKDLRSRRGHAGRRMKTPKFNVAGRSRRMKFVSSKCLKCWRKSSCPELQ